MYLPYQYIVYLLLSQFHLSWPTMYNLKLTFMVPEYNFTHNGLKYYFVLNSKKHYYVNWKCWTAFEMLLPFGIWFYCIILIVISWIVLNLGLSAFMQIPASSSRWSSETIKWIWRWRRWWDSFYLFILFLQDVFIVSSLLMLLRM